ncbi:hypothetical protein TBLA_0E01660 [Henningerozyma blattae CBS 6284]|uniref:Uncharacterized protein n=1 Tax=Henningerozyma blattae (strain ATCC 34711 / CBS 6284 / DSM 70876 / NBRC 10599 / NRRL Y-10934 / UCD 77-7) TaxID=1071380 RepID=I2H4C1_HENB6|nr:hypothetical protein TBLA_0E01660 [Tetrapisispora blattae CBS 6284]CCH61223.1 hypothetical protein TBLA_0E01660 [Tetrapisispora blattae CBS 6284]
MGFIVRTSKGLQIDLENNFTYIDGKKYYLIEEQQLDNKNNHKGIKKLSEKLENNQIISPFSFKGKLDTSETFHIWYRDIILHTSSVSTFWYQYLIRGDFRHDSLNISNEDENYIMLKELMSNTLIKLILNTCSKEYKNKLEVQFGSGLKSIDGHKVFIWIRKHMYFQDYTKIQEIIGELLDICVQVKCDKVKLEKYAKALVDEFKFLTRQEWALVSELDPQMAASTILSRGCYWGAVQKYLLNIIRSPKN